MGGIKKAFKKINRGIKKAFKQANVLNLVTRPMEKQANAIKQQTAAINAQASKQTPNASRYMDTVNFDGEKASSGFSMTSGRKKKRGFQMASLAGNTGGYGAKSNLS